MKLRKTIRLSSLLSIATLSLLCGVPSFGQAAKPSLCANRTPAKIKECLEKYGGGADTEKAVINALNWLKDNQNADGSWGDADPTFRNELTGLALLCFLGHGETSQSAAYGAAVSKGLERAGYDAEHASLLSTFLLPSIVMALSEAAMMTGDEKLKDMAAKGIAQILKGQKKNGGYSFQYEIVVNGNETTTYTAQTAWNFLAMVSARDAGVTVKDLDDTYDKVFECMRGVLYHKTKDGGGFCFSSEGANITPPSSDAMSTAAGVFCLYLSGNGKSQEVKSSLQYLSKKISPKEAAAEVGEGLKAMRGTYLWFVVNTFFQDGKGTGPSWKSWNSSFKKALISRQEKDGSWNFRGRLGGDFVQLDGKSLTAYHTAMSCLCLEVYYRYPVMEGKGK